MKQMMVLLGLVLSLVGFPNGVEASGSSIAKAMKDLRWGMSEDEVVLYLKHQIQKEYGARIKKAKGAKKQRLISQAKSKIQSIGKNRVEFNGRSRKWDNSVIAYEYTHKNSETMLVSKDDNSTNFYFFIEGALWKWFKAFDARGFKARNFKQFGSLLQKRFGSGFPKSVERYPGAGVRDVIEWRDRNTRMHALDATSRHNRLCLVFEELSTIRQLSALRTNPDKRYAKKTPAKKIYKPVAAEQKPAAKPQKKARKSVFAHEARDETDEEYEARRKKIMNKRKRAEQAAYERKKAEKRAKALDSLKGLEDNDPISGL